MPLKRTAGSRTKKINPKYENNGFLSESQRSQKWCTILCTEENRKYVTHAKKLETDSCDFVTDVDLEENKDIVWRYKGIPYSVEILSVHDEKPAEIPKGKGKGRYVEDSDSSDVDIEDEEDQQEEREPHPKKLKSNNGEALGSSEKLKEPSPEPAESNGCCSKSLMKSPEQAISNEVTLVDSSDDESSNLFKPRKENKGLNDICKKLVTPKRQESKLTKDNDILYKLDLLGKKIDQKFSILEAKCDLLMKSRSTAEETMAECKYEDGSSKYISENGVNLLSLRAINPEKYALALMDALFEDQQLSGHCFVSSAKSTKPPLPEEKTKLIQECIDIKYGRGTFNKNSMQIVRKCNQKCLDSNRRLKKANHGGDESSPQPKQ